MARKRIIDPEFWSDEEIGQWSFAARLFYIALWNFADDEGRFKAHDQLLKSQIFPYDAKIDIQKLKSELNSKIQWYEADNLQYGFIRNFLKHQRIDRPVDSKLPTPNKFVEDSSRTRRAVLPNRREVNIREVKRREGTGAPPASSFLDSLKQNPAYTGINIDIELSKMDAWLATRPQRKKTPRFIVSWLNRIEKPIASKPLTEAEKIDLELEQNRKVKK